MKIRILISVLLSTSLASPALASPHFYNVTYERCYDGDTCTVTIPSMPAVFGESIRVRVAGIDTPEVRGQCEGERVKAREARDAARALLSQAKRIDLRNVERGKYFRLVADIIVDGKSLSDELLKRGLARRYDGGTREGWCPSLLD